MAERRRTYNDGDQDDALDTTADTIWGDGRVHHQEASLRPALPPGRRAEACSVVLGRRAHRAGAAVVGLYRGY